jgi:hypothetical protein
MERFCGRIKPAVKSKKHPFTSVARRMRDLAQLNQIKIIYGLATELDLDVHDGNENSSSVVPACTLFHLIGRDLTSDNLLMVTLDPDVNLLAPRRLYSVDHGVRDKIAAYIATNWDIASRAAAQALPSGIIQWGKVKLLNHDGLTVHARDAIQRKAENSSRDTTFVKVSTRHTHLRGLCRY